MPRKDGIPTRLRSATQAGPMLEKMNPWSIPMRHSKSCPKSCTMWWLGLSIDNHKRCGFIEWVLYPVVLEAVSISAGSFSHRGMVKSMVCTPICNPSPGYYHYTLKLMYSIAHSLPRRGPPTPSQRPHYPVTPTPSLPALDFTATGTSPKSHEICTDPQLLIEEHPRWTSRSEALWTI